MKVPVGLRHNAFVYDSDDEFVGRMAAFLETGIAEGASALAITTRSNSALLRDALGPKSEQIAFLDRDAWYVRPATTIAAYHTTLRDLERDGAPSTRVVAEIQFGPTPVEWDEWTAYEAISNRALAEHPAWIMCPYDARLLPEQVIEGAGRTHPEVLAAGGQSCLFEDPAHVVRDLTPDHEPLADLRSVAASADPVVFREQLAVELAAANVPATKALNMLLAANEIVANALQHADGPELLRVGLIEGRFVCEITDHGPGFDDPMAGYLPPKPDEHRRGTGLWTARQLTSRLELISSADGLTVRLWL